MNKEKRLKKLKSKMENDLSLPLRNSATNLVFGEGNPNAEIVFIGEGPGYWEDVKGKPFVGNAGLLLNQLLQSIELERESVFITNVLMYRPPENRDPLPEEIKAFEPYLNEIIEIINPKIVSTLGRFSMAKFIPNTYISNIHGKPTLIDWMEKKLTVVPMYHPAAGLRNGMIKERLKEDFKILAEVIKNPGKGEIKENKIKKKEKQMSLI